MPDQTLNPNDQGDAVAEAQDLLNRAGAILDEDGKFGGSTLAAVREFRLSRHLPAGTDEANSKRHRRHIPL